MGKVIGFLLVMMSWVIGLQAQTGVFDNDTLISPADTIYKTVEVMPEFPGGQAALMEYLKKVPYVDIARESDLEGTTYIQFVIEKDGTVTEVIVARTSGHEEDDLAAVEHVKAMPIWKPGYQNGKPVRVQYVVPIKYNWQ